MFFAWHNEAQRYRQHLGTALQDYEVLEQLGGAHMGAQGTRLSVTCTSGLLLSTDT